MSRTICQAMSAGTGMGSGMPGAGSLCLIPLRMKKTMLDEIMVVSASAVGMAKISPSKPKYLFSKKSRGM